MKSKKIKSLTKQLNKILHGKQFNKGVVISLNGYWGVGKTYYWKKYSKTLQIKIQNKLDKNYEKVNDDENTMNNKFQKVKDVITDTFSKNDEVITHEKELMSNIKDTLYPSRKKANVIYISLFGLHSVKDIKSKIFAKMSSTNGLIDKFQKAFGKFKLSGLEINSVIDTFKAEDYKNTVICFDDFERISSNLNIREVLGFIAELKEDKKCKIVLINNNGILKEQDDLNVKNIYNIEIKDKLIDKELTKEIVQTNNHKIFSNYVEKIIDFEFYYNPTTKDNFGAIKKNLLNGDDLKFVDWDKVLEYLEKYVQVNKRNNVRFLKKFIYKLLMNKDYFDFDVIDKTVKMYIVIKLFSMTYELNSNYNLFMLRSQNIKELDDFITHMYENQPIDANKFKNFLQNINKEHNKNVISEKKEKEYFNFKADIDEKINDYYVSDDSRHDLANKIYNNLNDKKDELDVIFGFNLKYIVKRLNHIDKCKEDELQKLLEDTIAKIIDSFGTSEKYKDTVLSQQEEFANNKLISEKIEYYLENLEKDNNIESEFIRAKKALDLNNNHSNVSQMSFIKNINNQKHIEFISKKEGYFKLCINLINQDLHTIGDTLLDACAVQLLDVFVKIYKKNDEEKINYIYKEKIEVFLKNNAYDINQKESYYCRYTEWENIKKDLEEIINM